MSKRTELLRAVEDRCPALAGISSDYRRESFALAIPGAALNLIFALFHGIIGLVIPSAWYVSLSVYYLLLFLMRWRILRYEFLGQSRVDPADRALREWRLYRRCGGALMLASIALSGVVVLMVRNGHGKHYPGYLIYVAALYTFWKAIAAARNIHKARRTKAPLLICARNICCADALVSMLSLETAMLDAFGREDPQFSLAMVEFTGPIVCVLVILMGCFMLISGGREIRRAQIQRKGGVRP